MQYVFGAYTLDLDCEELHVAGSAVRLDRQVFAVLAYLAQRRDRVVRRQELFERLWSDRFVSDAALERCIAVARRAVGDSGRTQQVIQTVHGRGYRFIAPVEERPGEAAHRKARAALDTSSLDEERSRNRVEARSSSALGQAEPPSASLSAPVSLSCARPAGPDTREAERRQLTVLSCELVDVTTLIASLDSEDLHALMHSFHSTSATIMAQFDGFLAYHTEQSLVVYFGYPLAHEDDALRAVRAALALVATVQKTPVDNIARPVAPLSVRIGIHTGEVVVESLVEDQRMAFLAMGATPTIASSLRQQAEPNSVVVSETTAALIQGYVAWQPVAPYQDAAQSQALAVYRILGESSAQTRLEVGALRGLTPFVGREAELLALQDGWTQVQAGLGQVVVLRGEAGIGKSRLIEAFQARLQEPHTSFLCRSSWHDQNTAWYPIIELLPRILNWQPDDPATVKLEKLEQMLRSYSLPLDESVLLLADLLALPIAEERYGRLDLPPPSQRQRTLETLVALVLEQSEQQPVLLVFEDLHWTDPTTLELLELLIAQTPITSLYILASCRPEFQPPWRYRSYLTEITVSRLSQRQIERMAEQVAGGRQLPAAVLQQIVEKTDGVPLFVEEITKAVLESGCLEDVNGHYEMVSSFSSWSIPATLQGSLMARLDRLATAKAVAQYASVIGRQFSYELLCAVAPEDEADVQRELGRLVEAELLYQSGFPPRATYRFKHALVQDVAYQSILQRRRTQYHQRLAEVLVEQFPHTAESQPELLAHHYGEAGVYAQAIGYWLRAGEQAIRRSANVEAIRHLTRGIELLEELPVTAERTQQGLMLYMALGTCLASTKGAAAPETGQAYNRARELCQQTENASSNLPVLFGLWRFYLTSARLSTAKDLMSQLLRHAQRMQDPDVLVEVHLALGISLFFLGDLTASQEQWVQGMSYYDSRQHRSHTFIYGQDPGVVQLSHLSMVLWLLGYPKRAQQNSDDALILAREVSHPYSLVFALSYVASLHQLRREMQDVQGRTEEAISLATEHGFTQWVAHHMMLQGYCMAESGERENAIDQLCRSLSGWQATGALLALTYCLALLAEVYETANRIDEGLATVHEALNIVDKTGERWFEAELYRLNGELLLKQSIPDVTQAEAAFQQALDIARRQQAKSWELRAAMSLSRLWQQQGKRRDAHNLLAPVYAWFTEGFDTADLQDAKALLQELDD